MTPERESFMSDIPDPPMHYDKHGEPISLRVWAELCEDREYARVAETWIGKVRISTVWLGINHNFLWGPPMVFETMVFDHNQEYDDHRGNRVAPDIEMTRYTTLEAAQRGHEDMVSVIATLSPDESRVDLA